MMALVYRIEGKTRFGKVLSSVRTRDRLLERIEQLAYYGSTRITIDLVDEKDDITVSMVHPKKGEEHEGLLSGNFGNCIPHGAIAWTQQRSENPDPTSDSSSGAAPGD